MITVTISLDTELAWGRLNAGTREPLEADPYAGREAIQFILDTLTEYQIPATWAVVGHLLLESCEPTTHYTDEHVEALDPFTNVERNPLFYYPELVDEIADAEPSHEIAGHSFSHPRFSDLSREQARRELEAMCAVLSQRGFDIDTFVHPGIDRAHLDLLPEFGITTYSGACRYSNLTLTDGLPKLVRRHPALLSAPLVEVTVDEFGTSVVPRSRSLRDERWGWLNPRRVRSALSSETSADSKVLHLTFHPHNAVYDRNLRRSLPKVLDIIDRHREEGTVTVKTLGDLSANL